MNLLATKQTENTEAILTVSHRAAETPDMVLENLPDSVIVTTTQFFITGFNKSAEIVLGLREHHCNTKTLSEIFEFKFKNSSRNKALHTLFSTGNWCGDIILLSAKGKEFNFYSTAVLINNSSVIITTKLITEKSNTSFLPAFKLTESLFCLFMENSQNGCWIYDENDYIIFANKAYTDSLNYGGDVTGKHLSDIYPEKLARKLIERNKSVLKSNCPVVTEHALTKDDGTIINFVSNAFLIKTPGNKRFIGGQAIDITGTKNAKEQIEKMHERFIYAVNATSEAIWDLDLKTNEIYRSDAFYKISGYTKEQVAGNLNWWFDKIHPEDKERVTKNFEKGLYDCKKNWEDEYRFKYADGTYTYIADKGLAIYENNKPIRLIGSIKDVSERKKLEAQLLNEQVKKQKLINQATIEAQEKERGMISAELHDNVNQLLMSARLHIGAAKNNDDQIDLLDKASNYVLQAVEEIRSLSKRLNTAIVKTVGLEQSILDICRNMKQFNDITVTTDLQQAVTEKLTQEQQLVIFRIIQEQSNNIIKYSRASAATISLSEIKNQCCLIISDNGIGFDKEKQKVNGIGFINIFNRIDAYNGKVEINTYPDNGCTLNITMPYVV